MLVSGGGGGAPRTSEDGLILPSAFPARAWDLDTSQINGSATDLRTMGKSVHDQMTDIDETWSGLRDHYEAPEQGRVYQLMDPAVESARDLKTTLGKAAGHLDTYASSLDSIKPRLQDLEDRAWDFRNRVQSGVEVEKTPTATYRGYGMGMATDSGDTTEIVPWNEDEDTVAENKALLGEYGRLLEEISQAAATCANDINGLVEGKCVAPVEAAPAEAFTNPQQPMPWGSPVAEEKSCGEQVGDGATTFGTDIVQGLGQAALGYNPETGDFLDTDAWGQAWSGMGDLIGSTAVVAAAGYTKLGYAVTGHDYEEMPEWTRSEWMDERSDVAVSGWGSMVGYDHAAAEAGGSGWHKWKENPWEAATGAVLNVGTSFIPGAGAVGAGAKVVSTGGKLARVSKAGRVASEVADFAVPGGSWALKGALGASGKLKDIVSGVRPTVPKVFGGGHGSPHAGLIDAVDDVPVQTPARHTPVSDRTFGGDRAPAGEPGPSPTSGAPDGQPSSGVPESTGAGRSQGAESGPPVGRDGVGEPGAGPGKATGAGDRSPEPVESPVARDAVPVGAPEARSGADGPRPAGAPESPVSGRAGSGESPAPVGRGVPEQPVVSDRADRAPGGDDVPAGAPDSPVAGRAGRGDSPSPAGIDRADGPEARAQETGAGSRGPEPVGTGQAPDGGSPAVRPEEPLSGEGKSPDGAEPIPPAEGATSESGTPRGAGQADPRTADAGSRTMPEKWQPPAVDNHVDFGEIGSRTTFPPKGVELEPNSAYDVAGRGTYYTDPTGRVNHVVTDYGPSSTPHADLNNPAPDTTYVVGDKHVFVTDHKARTSEVHIPQLERGDAARSASIQSSVGRAAGPGHDGGHLIANAMGGGRERINIVAMLEELNRSGSSEYGRVSNSFYKFEKDLLAAVDRGSDVSLDLYATYGDSSTPSRLQAQGIVDGKPTYWEGKNVRR